MKVETYQLSKTTAYSLTSSNHFFSNCYLGFAEKVEKQQKDHEGYNQAEVKICFRCTETTNSSTLLIKSSKKGVILKNRHKNPQKSLNNRLERFITKKEMVIEVRAV